MPTAADLDQSQNQQGAPGLSTFFNSPQAAAPATDQTSPGLDSFFRAGQPAPTPRTKSGSAPIGNEQIDAVAAREGLTPVQRAAMGALLGQESGNGRNTATSTDGARGAGQILPATFKAYAKPGEVIDNPDHNLAVMARIVRDLGNKSGDDPAKIAVGYFSGSGNINPGSGTAWRNDRADGNGKLVSSYTADVMARMGAAKPSASGLPAPAPQPAAPKWASVVAKPEFQAMSDTDKAGARAAYFQQFIEPGIAPEQRGQYRTWFDGETAKVEQAMKPTLMQSIKSSAASALDLAGKVFLHTDVEKPLPAPGEKGWEANGPSVLDTESGPLYDAKVVGFRVAEQNRQALRAKLAAQAEYNALPKASASPFSLMQDVVKLGIENIGRAPDNLKAFELGAGRGFAKLGKYAALLASTPQILSNKSDNGDSAEMPLFESIPMLALRMTMNHAMGGPDGMFEHVVKPFDDAISWYDKNNGQLPQNVGNKVSNGLGDLAATLPAIIATGGGVNPQTKYMVDIAKYAFAQGMSREATMVLVKGSADTLGNAIVTMAPAAIPGAFERYQKLLDQGVDGDTAARAAFAEYATTTAMGALPLWRAGGVGTRAATGAAGGAALAAGSTVLQNSALGQYPQLQQDPLDPDNLIVGGATGAVLAGVMGHPRGGKVTVTRTDQQTLPRPPEPAFTGTTIDGETGRPIGEPDPHAPRLGGRIEPTMDGQQPQPEPSPPPKPAPTPEPTPEPGKPGLTKAQQTRVLDRTEVRQRDLERLRDGDTHETMGEDGRPVVTDIPGRALLPHEAQELAGLERHGNDPAALAAMYGLFQNGPSQPEATQPQPTQTQTPAPPAPTHADLIATRDAAIAEYRTAAETGNEAAAQDAEQKLATARQAIQSHQLAEAARAHQALADAAKVVPEKTAMDHVGAASPAEYREIASHADHIEKNGGADLPFLLDAIPHDAAKQLTDKDIDAYLGLSPADGAKTEGNTGAVAPQGAAGAGQTAGLSKEYLDANSFSEIDDAAHHAATSPTNSLPEPSLAQKEAGNYKKGHIKLHGMDISVENPMGSVRSGVDRDGKPWEVRMQHHYGYIRGTVGMDKDHIDTFIGPNPESQRVFVVDQVHPDTGKPDEHKIMLGFDSKAAARDGYMANYQPGWKGAKAITETTVEGFKDWLANGDTKKPFAMPKTEKQAAALKSLTIKEMTDSQLHQARDFYGPDHKRAASIAREIERRADDAANRGAPASSLLQSAKPPESQHVPATSINTQPNSTNPRDTDGLVQKTVPNDPGGTEQSPEQAGDRPDGARDAGNGGSELSSSGAAADRERSDQPVRGGAGHTRTAQRTAGDADGRRGGALGKNGVRNEQQGFDASAGHADGAADLTPKRAAQIAAEPIAVRMGDAKNIAETLPFLTGSQHADVLTAETRFAKPDGHGMLFTNGTGTGKAYLGAGVIKRMVKSGKGSGLIVAPNDAVIKGWIDSGQNLNLPIVPLASTSDAGSGVSITTFANFANNRTLADRAFDFVVIDEAQELMKSADANTTGALSTLRAITLHPRGSQRRADMLHRDLVERVAALRDTADQLASQKKTELSAKELAKAQAALKVADAELAAARAKVANEVTASQGARPRSLFLSATPFAYETNIQWAEGYLLNYPTVPERGGYNAPSPYDQFMITHFGYRMRNGKLTQPDVGVDRGLMQRQFNTTLRKSGALSARMLDVDADYDRKFVLVKDGIGSRIDEGMSWLRDAADGKYRPLYEKAQEQFDHLTRARLLEAIKAQDAVDYIKQHHVLGRKVIVFHDYNEGGGVSPFLFHPTKDNVEILTITHHNGKEVEHRTTWNDLIADFKAKRPDLAALDSGKLGSPLETLRAAFPKAGVYNGQTKKTRMRDLAAFNDDKRPDANLLIVQSAANAGWSGHDTSGKHQRVIINLGLPTAPTKAIQQEGRAYRVGQASDALFRYFNTGTSWERQAFASKIARRASTAENMAMGDQARGLLQVFVDAFESSDFYPPSGGEGKGGKVADRASVNALSDFDRAKAFYFGQQKKTSRTKSAEGRDYFATPEPVGAKMVEWLDLHDGDAAAEPSAGHGAIARWLPDGVSKVLIEPSHELASRLALVSDGKIINDDFETLHQINKFDGIAMNPPFGTGGKLAIAHLAKAFSHLNDGGRIVALLPRGPAADKSLDKLLHGSTEIPVKPISDDHGGIYEGDTVTTIHGTKGKAISAGHGLIFLKVGGAKGAIDYQIKAIKSVEPTGLRVRTVPNAPNLHLVADIDLPSSTFERAGTSVMTHIIVLEKQTNTELAKKINPKTVDLTGANNINDLFDRIETLSLPGKTLGIGESYRDLQDAQGAARMIEAGPLASGDEPQRVNTLGKLKSLRRKLDAKKLTEPEYLLGVAEVVNQIQKRNDARMPQDREAGPDWVQERLIRAKRHGDLGADTVEFALWAIRKSPALAQDLAISIKTKKNDDPSAGRYSPVASMVTLFKSADNPGTAVHEIMHHTERMMPDAVQRGIVNEWRRAWADAWKHADPARRTALDDMLAASTGDKDAFGRVVQAFKTGVLDFAQHYQLSNASEFWAVNATDILAGRYKVSGQWVGGARQWLSELLQKVKGWMGLRSNAPVLSGLQAVMDGTGERITQNMLAMGVKRDLMGESDTRRRMQSEFIDRWTDDDGRPVFYGRRYDLMPIRTFDASSDLSDNPLQLGQASMVELGNEVHDYAILDKSGHQVGTAILQVDPDGDIVGIHDIEATTKNQGIGTEVVRNIVASTEKAVAVVQIVPSAQKFWDSVGIYGQDGLYNNASIDWQSFAGSARIGSNRASGSMSRQSQVKPEDGSGNEASKRGTRGAGLDYFDLTNPRRVAEKSQKALIEEFGKPEFSSIDWWDKSVGTQFHKAQKNPHFKKVFDIALKRENATSLTAIRPAELAPAYLPRVDAFKSAVATLVKGKRASPEMDRASSAILTGTLYGDSVLDGKVFTDQELHDDFAMGSHGIMLYHQARAAIDASIDEVAAAEAFAALQMHIPRRYRDAVIDDPASANTDLTEAIEDRLETAQRALDAAVKQSAPKETIQSAKDKVADIETAKKTMVAIFAQAEALKAAGYAPLMRFGKYFVSVEEVDPNSGKTVINPTTKMPNTQFFGRYETEGEAAQAFFEQQVLYRGRDDMAVRNGPVNDEKYKMYAGMSPETIALFGEAIGVETVMHQMYQMAISERSALKRRLDRKNIAGYSKDMPRVLANFITSTGRHAAGRYYTRDLNNAIKFIPREKGDVQKEAQRLKEFLDNPSDAGGVLSALAFTWFLGGNIASAVVNATQPVTMTLPYLSQWGAAKAVAALTRAIPQAMGMTEISNPQLRHDLKRAQQEGKVDAQEIFHLYSTGIQGVSAVLAGKLTKLPLIGDSIAPVAEDVRARMNALATLWGMPFSMVEGFNRRLTFIAAWNMANADGFVLPDGMADPYEFAVNAVDQTQGIYNKVNRPNWARNPVGRVLFTFMPYRIFNVEILKRMATKGGKEGKKAAAMYLAVLILAAGIQGIPFTENVDDIIDTVGQWIGFNTNMKRFKREWAYKTLGKGFGDLALYGVSSYWPMDFSGRLGFGKMIPGTGLLKPSNEGNHAKDLLDFGGPIIGGLGNQVMDAYDAASMGNYGKATATMMPTAIKNAAAGLDMVATGKAKDAKGKVKADVDGVDAAMKMIGFNPTAVAAQSRANAPIYQDLALQRLTEKSIVEQWAQGAAQGDQAMMDKAAARLESWNSKNPETPIVISVQQIRAQARQILTPTNDRLLKGAPREMRGHVAEELHLEE